jgi:hypothetical protein
MPAMIHASEANKPTDTHTHRIMHLFTVATYRGIEAGWVPMGQPRSQSEAERLLSIVNRIRPDYINKSTIAKVG